jgi:stage V sporulation protein G
MEVTEVRVFLAEEERLKAYVTVTFDHCFVVRDLKIIKGNAGLFVAMPSKKKSDGTYKDIAHPIHSDFRSALEKTILDKYRDELKMIDAGFPIKRETPRDSYDQDMASSVPQAYETHRDYEAGIGPGVKK